MQIITHDPSFSWQLSPYFKLHLHLFQVTLLLVLIVCLIPKSWSPSRQYFAAIVVLASLVPILSFLLGFNAIYWALEFIFTGARVYD